MMMKKMLSTATSLPGLIGPNNAVRTSTGEMKRMQQEVEKRASRMLRFKKKWREIMVDEDWQSIQYLKLPAEMPPKI